jgi:type II secretory pathway pseudopilin PulG
MKKGLGDGAYTIIETMIFLAVSAFLFMMVVITFSGQQGKTQFDQSVKDFESRLLDMANDVSSGYYPSNNNFSCRGNAGDAAVTFPTASLGASPRGGNAGCIFAGQVISFTAGSAVYTVTPLAGKQQKLVGTDRAEVVNLQEANPVPIPGSTVTERTNYNIPITKVTASDGVSTAVIDAIAIMTTFGSYSGVDLNSGDIHADIIPLSGGIPSSSAFWQGAELTKNPAAGIVVCMQDGSGSNARRGVITIGGSGRQMTITTTIGSGLCP